MKASIILFISLYFILSLPLSAQHKATWYKEKGDKKVLFLHGWVEKHQRLPRKLLNYRQATLLNLSPAVRHVMYRDPRVCVPLPNESKLRKFPKWIWRLKQLEEVNLSNNPAFPYSRELPKLYTLPKLRVLIIEPVDFNAELVEVLGKFQHLEELRIYQEDIDEQLLKKLQEKLPNTSIN